LVVLSACETGLYEIDLNPDEFIGLLGAFTALGAAGVVGTLWPVSDTATPLLMARFYELHMGEGLPSPTALNRAQTWLRAATNLDLQGYARLAAKEGRLDSDHVAEIEEELTEEGLRRSRNNSAIEWTAPHAARTSGEEPTDAAKMAGSTLCASLFLGRVYPHGPVDPVIL
jgi:CHAT domain-containing protein